MAVAADPIGGPDGHQTCRCIACGAPFVLDADARRWYVQKGLRVPKRCPTCRHAARSAQARGAGAI